MQTWGDHELPVREAKRRYLEMAQQEAYAQQRARRDDLLIHEQTCAECRPGCQRCAGHAAVLAAFEAAVAHSLEMAAATPDDVEIAYRPLARV